jgi:YesN/AraC family two-component response regulator
MTVFRVEKYVVKPEKHEEYVAIMKKWVDYIKKNKETCKELRSWKLFSQAIGGNVGEYIEMWELESLADYEKFMQRVFHEQDESIAKIVSGFTTCTVLGTNSVSIWNSVM